ncbi:Cas10/Cmr2 second palm domain-containing protein [Nocardiopsis aegyptia]|uniref:CRISPR-associated protein Cmr2 n=1 Tax=Nocardiopsis aegyptia TaxID=220378 RepID=A0A7Z0EJP2_9ACTN|nr:type III-B CRISPR-associated protein Cas10/Cmr2 [Nocardiopsis aegyptia]NYJ32856.1 CRISPR-associated protein Cmr2 [Nocardiopsis aegyptia]
MSEPEPRDLVVIALSGVQRYITESRTTVDLRSASQIVAHLAAEAVRHLSTVPGARIVFPTSTREDVSGDDDGMPNRVVALLPPEQGSQAAANIQTYLAETWEEWVEEVFGASQYQFPGWPVVQWVSVPGGTGTYAQAWSLAQRSLTERKNVRDFSQPWDEQRELCSLSPRWRSCEVPDSAPKHQRKELLAQPNWVKRLWHTTETGRASGFASTNAIASSPYRNAVLKTWQKDSALPDLVEYLHLCADALGEDPVRERPLEWLAKVPGDEHARWLRGRGARWVFPGSWHVEVLAREFSRDAADPGFVRIVRDGWQAARALAEAMGGHGVGPPSPHLAVLVQDLDSMGRFLSGRPRSGSSRLRVSEKEHQRISRLLSEVARKQRAALKSVGGTVVYAGGDDLLALVPAAYALEAAQVCHDTIPPPPNLPTASTGLLFFHHDSSLRHALHRAHELLAAAKRRPDKHALGVGMLRHSGAHAECVLDWAGDTGPATDLKVFTPEGPQARVRLAPGLLEDLRTERVHLDGGDARERELFRHVLPLEGARRELRRLVSRHAHVRTSPGEHPLGAKKENELRSEFADRAAKALERMAPPGRLVDEGAVRVALFLRQEAS